jgi:replicative DNA helicase
MSTGKNGNKSRKKLYDNSPNEIGKLQPQAIELEEAVLGALLLDSEALDTVSKDLCEDLFYKEQNGIISTAILNLYKRSDRVDILTVCQELKTMGKLELVGGSFYVSSLTNRIASSANIEYHVKILQEHSLKRSAIRFCTNTIKKAYDESEDVFDLYAELQMDADNSIKDVMHYEVSSIGKIHQKNIEETKHIIESGVKSGVECGLELVDDLTGGWQKTDLVILAGRSGNWRTC